MPSASASARSSGSIDDRASRAIRLGIDVATGTDTGVRGVMPEMVWREIFLLNDHGLSAMGSIKAATSRAATLLGLEAEIGTVEPGKRADLILVDGDPLQDLRRLERPRLVMQAGRLVPLAAA